MVGDETVQGAAVSEVTLEERGRALENQFYEKENQEKLAAMKEKLDTQGSKDELRKASGMSDDAVLDKLVHLGLKANTIAALSLVPLIPAAWADGKIQDNERHRGASQRDAVRAHHPDARGTRSGRGRHRRA